MDGVVTIETIKYSNNYALLISQKGSGALSSARQIDQPTLLLKVYKHK